MLSWFDVITAFGILNISNIAEEFTEEFAKEDFNLRLLSNKNDPGTIPACTRGQPALRNK